MTLDRDRLFGLPVAVWLACCWGDVSVKKPGDDVCQAGASCFDVTAILLHTC